MDQLISLFSGNLSLIFLSIVIIFGIKFKSQIHITIVTLPRDLRTIFVFLKIITFALYCKFTNKTVHELFDIQAKKRRNKPCFYFEEEIWTFDKVQRESYKVANYFHSKGFKKGDTIALFMGNRPDYVCIWLGLSRIGVTTSLINYNVRLKALEHCVKTSSSKAIVFGSELTSAILEVIANDSSKDFKTLPLYCMADRIVSKSFDPNSTIYTNLSKALENASVERPPEIPVISSDTILNIFTSGTTGFPKAVIMTHSRMITFAAIPSMVGLKADRDIILTPIPLYHIQGGVGGVVTALFYGIPQVILKRFSASNFWSQCVQYNVTTVQYLGEIIRYLYNQPSQPEDKLHKVRAFIGNGVNAAIWKEFVERFNIKIVEIYGSTEGNCTLGNLEGYVGACGCIPIWAYRFFSVHLAKVDPQTGEIFRDPKTGLVEQVQTDECGELMSKIVNYNPYREFNGYTDKEATQKKIAHDVKSKGDSFFRSGDLISMDKYGYLFFKDRIGDTFRWKGENVSTAEVQEVISIGSGMKACAVYGVQVPGTEGRCGMAAIADPEGSLNLSRLYQEVVKCLPSYARPLFLRVTAEMTMTGTFKIPKGDLQNQGFNIEKIQDKVYFLSNESQEYVLLDKNLYEGIVSGKIRI